MEDAGFIIGCYVITFGPIAVYAWSVLRRARRATSRLPGRGQALDVSKRRSMSDLDLSPRHEPGRRASRAVAAGRRSSCWRSCSSPAA